MYCLLASLNLPDNCENFKFLKTKKYLSLAFQKTCIHHMHLIDTMIKYWATCTNVVDSENIKPPLPLRLRAYRDMWHIHLPA